MSGPVRIGVDVTCWANGRGYGRFARELMRAMPALAPGDEFICFGDRRAFDAGPLAVPNVRYILVDQRESPTTAASANGHRSLRDMLRFTAAVRREAPDVFFSPSVYTYFPLPLRLRAVVTVHDTIAERFPNLTLPTCQARLFWHLKVRLAIRQARLVLTVSDYSARAISAELGIPRGRLRVAVEAPATSYRPSSPDEINAAATRIGLPARARWFSYVGGFSPHKRIDVIIAAHAKIAQESASAPHLLLIGAVTGDVFHEDVKRLRAGAAALGTEPLVHWPGYVPDEELRHLLSGAVASLLPSECEGFGLPAVEAAACGTPVVATLESPLPELLAGGGLFVPPGDQAALVEAMRTLLGDDVRRRDMGRCARERASRLSWDLSARAALDAIYEAAA